MSGTGHVGRFALETQEAGTGKWFPIIIYSPDNEAQRGRAEDQADLFRRVAGLYVRLAPYVESVVSPVRGE